MEAQHTRLPWSSCQTPGPQTKQRTSPQDTRHSSEGPLSLVLPPPPPPLSPRLFDRAEEAPPPAPPPPFACAAPLEPTSGKPEDDGDEEEKAVLEDEGAGNETLPERERGSVKRVSQSLHAASAQTDKTGGRLAGGRGGTRADTQEETGSDCQAIQNVLLF